MKHLANVYVDGDTHTQSIEGFFGLFKNVVRGVYHSVSTTYLQDYSTSTRSATTGGTRRTPMFYAILDRVRQKRSPSFSLAPVSRDAVEIAEEVGHGVVEGPDLLAHPPRRRPLCFLRAFSCRHGLPGGTGRIR